MKKEGLKLGSWKLEQSVSQVSLIENVIENAGLDVFVLQCEAGGCLRINNYICYYGGQESKCKIMFYVKRNIDLKVFSHEIYSPQISALEVGYEDVKINLISVDIPIIEMESGKTYLQLLRILEMPNIGELILMGSFNAKIGILGSELYNTDIIGPALWHETSDFNGKILINLAHDLHLKVCNTMFYNMLNRPWRSYWDKNTDETHQIDHILMRKNSVMKVKSCECFDYAVPVSDHLLLVASVDLEGRLGGKKIKDIDDYPSLTLLNIFTKMDNLKEDLMKHLEFLNIDVACLQSNEIPPGLDTEIYKLFQPYNSDVCFLLRNNIVTDIWFQSLCENISIISFKFINKPKYQFEIIGLKVNWGKSTDFMFNTLHKVLGKQSKDKILLLVGNFNLKLEDDYTKKLCCLLNAYGVKYDDSNCVVNVCVKSTFDYGTFTSMCKEFSMILFAHVSKLPSKTAEETDVAPTVVKELMFATWDIKKNDLSDMKDVIDKSLQDKQINICCLQADEAFTTRADSCAYESYQVGNSQVLFLLLKNSQIINITFKTINQHVSVLSFKYNNIHYYMIGCKVPVMGSKIVDLFSTLDKLISNIKQGVELVLCGNFDQEYSRMLPIFQNKMNLIKNQPKYKTNRKSGYLFTSRECVVDHVFTSFVMETDTEMLMANFSHHKYKEKKDQTFTFSTWCILTDLKHKIELFEKFLVDTEIEILCLQNLKNTFGEFKKDLKHYLCYETNNGLVTFLVKKCSNITDINFTFISKYLSVLECKYVDSQRLVKLVGVYLPRDGVACKIIDDFTAEVNKTSSNCFTVVIGNFNAEIGVANVIGCDYVGRNLLHERNNFNGDLLVDFARNQKFHILTTMCSKVKIKTICYETVYKDLSHCSHVLVDKDHLIQEYNIEGCLFDKIESGHKLIKLSGKFQDRSEEICNPIFNDVNLLQDYDIGFHLATWHLTSANSYKQTNLKDSVLRDNRISIACADSLDYEVPDSITSPNYNWYINNKTLSFFIVDKNMPVTYIKHEVVTKDISVLKFKFNNVYFSLICVVFTPGSGEVILTDLKNYIKSINSRCVMVVGNFGALVGSAECEGNDECVGTNCLSATSNLMGSGLVKMARETRLKINTTFFHQNVLKLFCSKNKLSFHLLTNYTDVGLEFGYFSKICVRNLNKLFTMHVRLNDKCSLVKKHKGTYDTIDTDMRMPRNLKSDKKTSLVLATWNVDGTPGHSYNTNTVDKCLKFRHVDIAFLQQTGLSMGESETANYYWYNNAVKNNKLKLGLSFVLRKDLDVKVIRYDTPSKYMSSMVMVSKCTEFKLIGVHVFPNNQEVFNDVCVEYLKDKSNRATFILGDFSDKEDNGRGLFTFVSCLGLKVLDLVDSSSTLGTHGAHIISNSHPHVDFDRCYAHSVSVLPSNKLLMSVVKFREPDLSSPGVVTKGKRSEPILPKVEDVCPPSIQETTWQVQPILPVVTPGAVDQLLQRYREPVELTEDLYPPLAAEEPHATNYVVAATSPCGEYGSYNVDDTWGTQELAPAPVGEQWNSWTDVHPDYQQEQGAAVIGDGNSWEDAGWSYGGHHEQEEVWPTPGQQPTWETNTRPNLKPVPLGAALKIGTWNIGGYNKIGQDVDRTLAEQGVDIACVQFKPGTVVKHSETASYRIYTEMKRSPPSVMFMVKKSSEVEIIKYSVCSTFVHLLIFKHASLREEVVMIGINASVGSSMVNAFDICYKYRGKACIVVLGEMNALLGRSVKSHKNKDLIGKYLHSKTMMNGLCLANLVNENRLKLWTSMVEDVSLYSQHLATSGLNMDHFSKTQVSSIVHPLLSGFVVGRNEEIIRVRDVVTGPDTTTRQHDVFSRLDSKEPPPRFQVKVEPPEYPVGTTQPENYTRDVRVMPTSDIYNLTVTINQTDVPYNPAPAVPAAGKRGNTESLADMLSKRVRTDNERDSKPSHQSDVFTRLSKASHSRTLELLQKASGRFHRPDSVFDTNETPVPVLNKEPAIILACYDILKAVNIDVLTQVLALHKIDIACIYIQDKKRITDLANYRLYDSPGCNVKFLVSKNLQVTNLNPTMISPSIFSLSFKCCLVPYEIQLIGVLAITKSTFLRYLEVFDELHKVLNNTEPNTHVLVLGQFNARLGRDHFSDEREVTGPYLHYNASGGNYKELIRLCRKNCLRIETTFCPIINDEVGNYTRDSLAYYTSHVLRRRHCDFSVKIESVFVKHLISSSIMLKTYLYFN